MTPRIIVLAPSDVTRRGLEAVIAAAGRYMFEAPDRLPRYRHQPLPRAAVVVARDEEHWRVVEELARADRGGLVVMLPDHTLAHYQRARAIGATVVLPLGSKSDVIVRGCDCAVDGHALMPAPVLDSLGTSPVADPADFSLTDRHVRILELLADGFTVVEVARLLPQARSVVHDDINAIRKRLGVHQKGTRRLLIVAAEHGLVR